MIKKKILYSIIAIAILVVGCSSYDKSSCHISGSIDSQWNGQKIFLVPALGASDAAHVDSVVIENGSFEFVKDTVGVYDIRMAWMYQSKLQDLLVVTEPGEVKVMISSNSSASGTAQNDSLQAWKQITQAYNLERNKKFPVYRELLNTDSAKARLLEKDMHDDFLKYKERSKILSAHLPQGPLKAFLNMIFPNE